MRRTLPTRFTVLASLRSLRSAAAEHYPLSFLNCDGTDVPELLTPDDGPIRVSMIDPCAAV